MRKEIAMGLFSRLTVSEVSCFFCGEAPQSADTAINSYSGLPRVVLQPRLKCHAFEAVLTGTFGVRSILPVAGFTEVFNPIVRPASINVVDLIRRFNPVEDFPSKPVGRVVFSGDFYVNVSTSVDATCDASSRRPASPVNPPENPAFGIVTDNELDVLYIHAYSMPGPEWDCQGRLELWTK